MICEKCLKNFNEKAEKYVTYNGIDYHHNPPQFMFENNETWNGRIIALCRNCHRNLHIILLEIMNKYSNLLKKNKSEYWIWLHTTISQRLLCRKEIEMFTNKWLGKRENDTNTTTTTKS